MSTIGEVAVRAYLDDKDLDKGLDKAEKKSKKFSDGLTKTVKTIGAIGIAAAGAVGTALVSYGNLADKMLDLSEITGLTTDEMQKWQQVATDAGVDTDIVTNAMQGLNKQLERGNELSPRLQKAFETMNIDVEEFKNIGADEQMRLIVQQMLDLEGADRRAFANQMNMADMLPLISQLESEGKDLNSIMQEIDVPFSNDDLAMMNEFRQAWDNLKRDVFNVIGQALLPVFAFVTTNMPVIKQVFAELTDSVKQGLEIGFGLINTFVVPALDLFWSTAKTVFDSFSDIITTVKDIVSSFFNDTSTSIIEYPNYWQDAMSRIQWAVETVMTVVTGVIDVAMALVKKIFGDNLETIQSIVETVMSMISKVVNEKMFDVMSAITDVLDAVSELWDKYGHIIMDIVSTVFGIVFEVIDVAMKTAAEVIEATMDIIIGILKIFTGLFTGDWETFTDGLKLVWQGLWGAIRAIIRGAWRLISAPFRSLYRSIRGWFVELKDDAFAWGIGLIDGFIGGIKSMADSVGRAVSNVIDTAKSFIGFGSPTEKGEGRYVVEWGENMIDGFLDGVKNATPQLQAVMSNVIPGAGSQQASSNITNQFTIQGMSVRSDNDISLIARELYNLQQQRGRGVGIV